MLTACDMNRDGQISKPELFTLFKRVLMGDSSVYPTMPQQQNYGQYGQGGNQYPPNQGGNKYQGGNNNLNPYQQNQGNMGNQPGYQNNNQQGPRYH